MRKVDDSIIKNLIAYEGEPVLTMYIPTHRFPTPPNIQEDQTRFKNVVRAGCQQWSERADEKVVQEIQRQIESYVDDISFWQDTIETLAVFAYQDRFEMYHLPIETEERFYVDTHFDVTPLLLVQSMNRPSYVFALAMHEPKLYKADLYNLEPIEIDFPKSPEDALNIDEMFSNSNTIRHGRSAGSNSVPASPHGQGDSNDAGTEERLKYFRILDEKIQSMKDFDDSLPFIIAATDTEFGDFHTLSSIKGLVDIHIPGNHTTSPPQQLHQLALKLVREHIQKAEVDEVIEKVGEFKGVQKASTDIDTISSAAQQGRVDALLLPLVDVTTDSVSDRRDPELLIRYPEAFNSSLLSVLMNVVSNGGRVIAVEQDSLPGLSPLAAIYRY